MLFYNCKVSTKEMPAPKDSGLPLNAYMLHNLAHVELNAINLAWDTVVRFSPQSEILGRGFFEDFAHVADDESRHFAWCSQRLAELGFRCRNNLAVISLAAHMIYTCLLNGYIFFYVLSC